MASTQTFVRSDDSVRAVGAAHAPAMVMLSVVDRHGDRTDLVLPDGDEDALLFLELLEAAIDNAASIVRLRQSRREREAVA